MDADSIQEAPRDVCVWREHKLPDGYHIWLCDTHMKMAGEQPTTCPHCNKPVLMENDQ